MQHSPTRTAGAPWTWGSRRAARARVRRGWPPRTPRCARQRRASAGRGRTGSPARPAPASARGQPHPTAQPWTR
eukprot:6974834-Alexandrium_andersonii.AAC.1